MRSLRHYSRYQIFHENADEVFMTRKQITVIRYPNILITSIKFGNSQFKILMIGYVMLLVYDYGRASVSVRTHLDVILHAKWNKMRFVV